MGLLDFLKNLFGGGGEVTPTGWSKTPPRSKVLGVDELARRLGATREQLEGFQPVYQEFDIPKQSGGKRRISAPSPELKALQRKILKRLLARVKCHEAVHGFERGRSILTNAGPHVGSALVIHVDIQDFFPSTSARRIAGLYQRLGWDSEATKVLVKLTTHRGGLPQGAPTSPRLANLVNLRIDARLSGLARRFGGSYTRYADDLTFSSAAEKMPILGVVGRILAEDGYKVHKRRKMHVRRAHQRQMVTGLVVNEKAQLPRETRRWLRAVEHRLKTKGQATLKPEQLAGWRSFQGMLAQRSES